MNLRKPMIRKLEAMAQCIEAIQADLADALIEVRDILAPPPPKNRSGRKGVGREKA